MLNITQRPNQSRPNMANLYSIRQENIADQISAQYLDMIPHTGLHYCMVIGHKGKHRYPECAY
jgi:hypothetical protein